MYATIYSCDAESRDKVPVNLLLKRPDYLRIISCSTKVSGMERFRTFRESVSELKKKSPDAAHAIRTAEHIENNNWNIYGTLLETFEKDEVIFRNSRQSLRPYEDFVIKELSENIVWEQ
ncbi:hypothetical protein HZH68_000961 [Vespula germanica]|uniref:Uncharacterized protein n=1 Tax=Vespula germanica TaxID=30212 RepID=A0A834U6G0_VESGE|nr:hypothetical protein HZH68_000961 [Vespula germanica]